MTDRIKFKATERNTTDKARLLELESGREVWIGEQHIQEYPGGYFSVPKWIATADRIKGEPH